MHPKEKFEQFKQNPANITSAILDTFFDELPPVTVETLIGDWKGGHFNFQSNEVRQQLEAMRWYGKSLRAANTAYPLICLNAQDEPYTFADMGAASLRMILFRNQVTAAMIYDNYPIIDYFHQVDEHTLIGIMEGKVFLEEGEHFYFFLERI
ncbi:DUF4334 domain-containing protein [Chitinophaga nivalis]|uniref:DUF4334 domain-containing protein n=1 Tax=Chitinophaga nivalis TaxID=2991709 RepID=A0ABT3IQY2_9BACT|nr:DUF4334 domain-containing protein [Chitinophaga nivalis]MCW3463931.1 DUF4334 domain-containing protein [Chitinophaga nivalis]MCW3486379.1 DUF4334 domain-containing protein [Chitinophaga nivalis]